MVLSSDNLIRSILNGYSWKNFHFPDGSADTTASNEANGTIAEAARNPVVVESDAAITPAAMAAAVVAAVEATNSDVSRQEKSLQTDPFLAYPYEHLFPSVLPSWFACHHTGKVSCRNMISGTTEL